MFSTFFLDLFLICPSYTLHEEYSLVTGSSVVPQWLFVRILFKVQSEISIQSKTKNVTIGNHYKDFSTRIVFYSRPLDKKISD